MASPVVVRLLGSHEAAVLDHVAPDVFDHAVDPRWASEFFADPRHHLVVALEGELVVGMASGLHYVHPDKARQLFVNEVGVAPTHEGQGLGRRLLETLLAHGRSLGCVEAWVATELTNERARRLYLRAGGEESPDHIVMYTFRMGSQGRVGGEFEAS